MTALENRKGKFKPILSEELNEFADKVDQIVDYLTRRRQDLRDQMPRGEVVDASRKSQKYFEVADARKEQR